MEDDLDGEVLVAVVEGASEQVGEYYHPALTMDGTPVAALNKSQDASACGVWVERDGTPVIELAGVHAVSRKHE